MSGYMFTQMSTHMSIDVRFTQALCLALLSQLLELISADESQAAEAERQRERDAFLS